MCAPTRQQLYTGMYPVRNGAYPNHSMVHAGVKSIAHYLKALGYRVGLTGKTHFKPPESFPFETVGPKGDKRGASNTQAIAAFVNRDRRQPYCLVVASNEPHGPWNKGDPSVYDAARLTVPPYLVDCPETREAMTKYYAEITFLDGQLGDCMKIVDTSGRRDNTIVIFTSEQGTSFPAGGKWTCYDTGLRTAFIVRWPARAKAGTRTQAMTQYVDVVPTLIEAGGGNADNIETGRPDADGNKGFDGKSFLAVLLGKANEHRDYVYGAHTTRGIIRGSACYPVRSVRSRRYKYIRNLSHESVFYNAVSTGPNTLLEVWTRRGRQDPKAAFLARRYQHRPAEELYDVQKDPFELDNLANDPGYAKIKDNLREQLALWMKQQGDKGVDTELRALERQGPNRKWTPFNPNRPQRANKKEQTRQRKPKPSSQ
jgi:N-sulfoglucosamine sulfohydrolase